MEAVVRRLTAMDGPSHSDFLRACQELGMKRSRLHELSNACRERPVTSPLTDARAGAPRGARYLSVETESVIAEAADSSLQNAMGDLFGLDLHVPVEPPAGTACLFRRSGTTPIPSPASKPPGPGWQ